ncbi:MAG: hypothetical protein ACP5QO_07905, partial [Clostridia bacterium]
MAFEAPELPELLGPMPPPQTPHDHARRQVAGGKQACGPGPRVIVAPPFGAAGQRGEDRWHPVERLNRGLLLHAQDDGPLRRVPIQADHIADLVYEERIRGALEGLGPVRLQPKQT